MTYAIQELVVRRVSPFDATEITGLVAAAMRNGPVARRVLRDPAARRRNRGAGSAVRDRHPARLDRAGRPACREANDPRNRDRYLRHGSRARSVIGLPDGPPLRSMWRVPMP
jgi:hypothetical protein